MSRLRQRAAALGLALALLAGGLAFAPAAQALTGQEKEALYQRIIEDLRCPTCQGLSVRDSDAPLSRQIKDKVRRMVEEGQTEEAIKAFFVSRYGEWILRAPKNQGLGLVVWVLPGLGMVLVAGWLGLRFRRNRKHKPDEAAAPAEASAISPEQRERIARDRRRFEELD